mmetsp:Transcript_1383/g.2437  ORF Transcript_1383/g.2437 Transcript_1383/m.2437 type:complete len:125 (-) Transcript_1383:2829-3203(-)
MLKKMTRAPATNDPASVTRKSEKGWDGDIHYRRGRLACAENQKFQLPYYRMARARWDGREGKNIPRKRGGRRERKYRKRPRVDRRRIERGVPSASLSFHFSNFGHARRENILPSSPPPVFFPRP